MSVVTAALITLTPVNFHTQAQQAEWLEAWGDRVTDQGHLTLELLEERWDFITRHIPPVKSQSATTRSQSSNVPRSMGGGVEQWRSLVAAHFPTSEVERALCIMSHESGGNPTAKNPRSSAAGLFQFLKSTWNDMVPRAVTGGTYDSGAVYDPVANTRAAAWLALNVGWSQWSPYQRGLCR